ncbi:amidohydrolase family protein [Burkholderia orbicola]|uniref:amidohydrolase family protein n=1 Tax=Burkholderia orbicola TaxID=2978683 RepID=UPI0039A62043
MYIDVHGHAIENMFESAGQYGPRVLDMGDGKSSLEVGPYRSKPSKSTSFTAKVAFNDPTARIAEMDRRGIDHLIQSTSPLFYLYWAEAEIGIRSTRIQNDAMAASTALHPTRLSWSATLPLQDIKASIEELDRALSIGAKSVSFGTNALGGRELDDEALWPLYEKIQALDLPIILHPHPLTMASGSEDRYNLSWVVGYNYSETMAFARLTLGGVFDDFPKLRVVLPHGGGNVPYQIGRIEEARKSQSDNRAKRPVEEYFENVYFEILIHDIRARRFLLDVAGPSQIVIGSNLGGWDGADGIQMLKELNLPKQQHDMIAFQNAMNLFKLHDVLAPQNA